MPAIPLYSMLFLFLVFLAIFFIFAIINVYHIVMSASFTLPSFLITFFVFALAGFTLYATWALLGDVTWTVSIFDLSNVTPPNEYLRF